MPRQKSQKITLRKWRYNTDEGISVQETKFADFYTENPIGKEAAERAGIPPHLAQSWSSHTLRKLAVKRRISDNLEEMRNSTIMQARERREILTQIARATLNDALTLDVNGAPVELDLRQAKQRGSHRAISGITMEDSHDCQGGSRKARTIKMISPIAAIDTLNKMDHTYDKKLNAGGGLVIIPLEDMEL
jgi:phage terminase small subunit